MPKQKLSENEEKRGRTLLNYFVRLQKTDSTQKTTEPPIPSESAHDMPENTTERAQNDNPNPDESPENK